MSIQRASVITCPQCAFTRRETMPLDQCLWFWECPQCKALIRPRAGDCCVYCSYGSRHCPPVQQSGRGCCG